MTPAEIAAKMTPAYPVSCDCPLHTLFPMRIADIVEPTFRDRQAACDLIGRDTYGKPYWTPETIDRCHPVVQAFARHARTVITALSSLPKKGA